MDEFLTVRPNVHVTSPEHATVLGSPIGVSTDESILEKIHDLRVLEDRVQYLHAHDALLLLRNSLAILCDVFALHLTLFSVLSTS